MRRVKKPKYSVSTVRPIFTWCSCINCNYEFKDETGWQFKNQNGYICYICSTCAPNINTADRMATAYNCEGYQPIIPQPKGSHLC